METRGVSRSRLADPFVLKHMRVRLCYSNVLCLDTVDHSQLDPTDRHDITVIFGKEMLLLSQHRAANTQAPAKYPHVNRRKSSQDI